MTTDKLPRIAVIGMGPRGLGALEALGRRIPAPVAVDVFEPLSHPGAGPNYAPDQTPLCLLNTPLRLLDLPPAGDGAGPGPRHEREAFLPRSRIGDWLARRFDGLDRFPLRVTRRQVMAEALWRAADGWWIATGQARHGPYAEVLLTQGQPESAPDDQLARWRKHAATVRADLMPAYPAAGLLAAAPHWTGRDVAIRGLGLATLDVLRLLTLGQGGRFEQGRYHPSGREPGRILPFSLNGHAPVPKPAGATQDSRFDPREEETAHFRAALSGRSEDVVEALIPPALRILGGTRDAVRDWLRAEWENPACQEDHGPVEALRRGIAMATGALPPDIGFTLGQLWRKWQGDLRDGFAPDRHARLVGFDEGMKRYSYGPPVQVARELLITVEHGLVDLRAADDPDIILTGEGWRLGREARSATVAVMIDAVLPDRNLTRIRDPLLAGLIDAGRIRQRNGGGAHIRRDGQVVGRDGQVQPGLCLLGRLATGSVIAVDSLHDCFGPAADRWAEGVLRRGTLELRGVQPYIG